MPAFWEIVASNAVVATILAIGAMLLGRIWKNAAALHVLWVVVLLKLFTPPLVTTDLPFALPLRPSAARATTHGEALDLPKRDNAARTTLPDLTARVALTDSRGPDFRGNSRPMLENRSTESAGTRPWSLFTVLAAIWICGACCTAAGYAVRIRRFASVIRDMGQAPPAIRAMVDQLSVRLGLRRVPEVLMTSLTLPPLVWSIGRFPRVILPSGLFAHLSSEAQSTILAHELSHIRRGDHLVRFLELVATTIFWWHPMVRWAGRQLRELEEQCCDGQVLELLPHQPRTYAAAMVDTLEFLSEGPRTRVPLTTAIDSTGSLSRRIQMLTLSRSNRVGALGATV
jgi:bla regulator protein BlaR1